MNIEEKFCDLIKSNAKDIPVDRSITTSRPWQEVRDIMVKDVTTIPPDATAVSAAKLMSQNNISSIIVVQNEKIVGILTEMDFLKRIVEKNKNLDEIKISQIMSSPVTTIPPNLSVFEAGKIAKDENVKRLPVVKDGILVGITTQTDLIRVLTSYGMWRDISEIMSVDVAEIQKNAAVMEAIETMTKRNISCVVVRDNADVVGVFTERDFLKRVIAPQLDPKNTKIEQVMSRPIISVPSSYSVFSTSRIMEKTNIHRLLVMEDNKLLGIVTQTDIFFAVKKKLQLGEERNFELLKKSENSIYTMDMNHNVTYVNPAFLKLFDVSNSAEFINKPFLPKRYWCSPQDREQFLEELIREGGIEIKELALKTYKGKKIYVTLFSTLTKNTHGEINGSQGMIYNITAKKELVTLRKTEEILRESEERYRRITNAVTDYIYTVYFDDNEKPVKTIHGDASVAVTGYTSEELNSEPMLWLNMVYTDDRDAVREQAEKCSTGKNVEPLEHRIIHKNGNVRWLKSTLVPHRNSQGRLLSYDGLLADTTERKKAEENLKKAKEQAEKSTAEIQQINTELQETYQKLMETSHQAGMGEVATDVLHNVGNILNSVNVSATIISEKVMNPEIANLKKLSDLMQDHSENLAAFLTEDPKGKYAALYLNEVSNQLIEGQSEITGQLDSLIKNLDHIKEVVRTQQMYAKACGVEVVTTINEIMEHAIQINQASLKKNNITLIRQYCDLGNVTLDKQKVLQIIVNLINNAKYALANSQRDEKLLTIRFCKYNKDTIRVEVSDNGIGITPQNLDKIFRHGFTTKKYGHGFGLHSSALSAKEISGSLTVQSDGPDKGAKFTLELPYKPTGAKKQCIT